MCSYGQHEIEEYYGLRRCRVCEATVLDITRQGWEIQSNHGLSLPPKDPNGLDAHASGAKLDAGKPDLSLLLMFGKALRAVGDVGTFGAAKYSRGGWRKVENGETRYTAALLRHLMLEDTETLDPESQKLHAAHAAWNALARLELILSKETK